MPDQSSGDLEAGDAQANGARPRRGSQASLVYSDATGHTWGTDSTFLGLPCAGDVPVAHAPLAGAHSWQAVDEAAVAKFWEGQDNTFEEDHPHEFNTWCFRHGFTSFVAFNVVIAIGNLIFVAGNMANPPFGGVNVPTRPSSPDVFAPGFTYRIFTVLQVPFGSVFAFGGVNVPPRPIPGTSHPGGNPGANLKSISHRCHLFEVAFVWEFTKETIVLPLVCLQGGVPPRPIPGTSCVPETPFQSRCSSPPAWGACVCPRHVARGEVPTKHAPDPKHVPRGAAPRPYRGTSLIRNTHPPRITRGP